MVWSDIRLVKAKFQEQIPRKPDLNNIKIIIVTYFMLLIQKYCYYRPESDWHLINGNNFGFG